MEPNFARRDRLGWVMSFRRGFTEQAGFALQLISIREGDRHPHPHSDAEIGKRREERHFPFRRALKDAKQVPFQGRA